MRQGYFSRNNKDVFMLALQFINATIPCNGELRSITDSETETRKRLGYEKE